MSRFEGMAAGSGGGGICVCVGMRASGITCPCPKRHRFFICIRHSYKVLENQQYIPKQIVLPCYQNLACQHAGLV